MTDLDTILPLWRELRESRTEYVLGTVVAVEGSGYRKAGARILIAADGRRAGTISGGCLEGDVARKAFWHTENGPVVRRYSTSAEDGDVPFGMGCGGVVHLLLERGATADGVLRRLEASFETRRALAIATVLDGKRAGERGYWPPANDVRGSNLAETGLRERLEAMARRSFEKERSFEAALNGEDGGAVWVEQVAARPGLFVFGAGDDAIPMVRLARQLGWYVAVSDGRGNLAAKSRFAEAHEVRVLAPGIASGLDFRPTDAAVVMSHSLEQDTAALHMLLDRELAYVGVLGPRRRTIEVLRTIAVQSGIPESRVDGQVRHSMERIHAPMGLDLGGETPAEIALAVLAEIQLRRKEASGLALREVRGKMETLPLSEAASTAIAAR